MEDNINKQLEECRRLIESQLGWKPAKQWKQRDYEQLSELILEKTGTCLSLSTLKRVWTGQFSNAPQPATLNALAQYAGFSSWKTFRLEGNERKITVIGQPETDIKSPKNIKWFNKFRVIVSSVVLIGIIILLFLKIQSSNKSSQNIVVELNPEVKFTHKILAEGLPNTVVFSFDLNKLEADSFFFQQNWNNKTRVPIPEKSKNFTSIYYYPGYHSAKLFAGKTQVAEQKVHIKTHGWQGLVMNNANQSMPVYLNDTVADGMLFLDTSIYPISKLLADKQEFFIRYYNISDFDQITGDSFRLSAKIRNDIEHGGLTCQDVNFYISCESGMIFVPFCGPGCVGNLNMFVGDHYLAGQNNDLSALGINLSEWQDIVIFSNGKSLQIKTSSSKLSANYGKPLGKIKGLIIEFRGSGAIEEISLGNNLDEKPEYAWMFD